MKADREIKIELTRRKMTKLMSIGAVMLPVAKLLGCDSESDGGADMSAADMDMADMDVADMGAEGGAGGGQDPDMAVEDPDAAPAADAWATGGTAAMVDVDSYPDPFIAGVSACALSCTATIGPCHTTSPEREDISDGLDGLPVRLSFMVINEECEPVEDVLVEVWHTNYHGIYSGEISTMCNDAEEDRAAEYFRGYLRTDANGQVHFKTCFPGWYSGRVVHYHVRVQSGDYQAADNADAEVITQFFFTDELNSEIFAEQPLYQQYGEPDTHIDDDNIIGGEDDPTPYILDVARMSDGAMQASKTIILRSSSDSACSLSGAAGGGPGGPGGEPPDRP